MQILPYPRTRLRRRRREVGGGTSEVAVPARMLASTPRHIGHHLINLPRIINHIQIVHCSRRFRAAVVAVGRSAGLCVRV